MSLVPIYAHEHVRRVQALYADLYEPSWVDLPIRDHLEELARRLAEGHARGDLGAAAVLGNWLPRLAGAPADIVLATDVTSDDVRHAVARDHGFEQWDRVTDAVGTPDREFETTVDAVVAGDLATLRSMLTSVPELARASSRYGHRATLLHYAAANAVEIRRQQVPTNIPEVARALIRGGADANAKAWMYGGWEGPLAMLASSVHPAKAGVRDALMALLMDAGAEAE